MPPQQPRHYYQHPGPDASRGVATRPNAVVHPRNAPSTGHARNLQRGGSPVQCGRAVAVAAMMPRMTTRRACDGRKWWKVLPCPWQPLKSFVGASCESLGMYAIPVSSLAWRACDDDAVRWMGDRDLSLRLRRRPIGRSVPRRILPRRRRSSD